MIISPSSALASSSASTANTLAGRPYMTTQHEFCCVDQRPNRQVRVRLSPDIVREHRRQMAQAQAHLLCRLVEHLALCAKRVGPVDQTVELLASLKHRLDGLVLKEHMRGSNTSLQSFNGYAQPRGQSRDLTHQHNLCLVELLLDLHDCICLFRVLVLLQVRVQGGPVLLSEP